jgi:hypothetical protein
MKRISVKLILLKTIKLNWLIHHFKGNVLVLIVIKIKLILLNRLEKLEIAGLECNWVIILWEVYKLSLTIKILILNRKFILELIIGGLSRSYWIYILILLSINLAFDCSLPLFLILILRNLNIVI